MIPPTPSRRIHKTRLMNKILAGALLEENGYGWNEDGEDNF
jgi:hypothetical protein